MNIPTSLKQGVGSSAGLAVLLVVERALIPVTLDFLYLTTTEALVIKVAVGVEQWLDYGTALSVLHVVEGELIVVSLGLLGLGLLGLDLFGLGFIGLGFIDGVTAAESVVVGISISGHHWIGYDGVLSILLVVEWALVVISLDLLLRNFVS